MKCKAILLLATVIMLGACSSVDKSAYKSARTLPPLEIPPDLMSPAAGDDIEMTVKANGVFAAKSALIRERDGALAVVINDMDFATAWSKVGDILAAIGVAVEDGQRSKGLYRLNFQGEVKRLSIEDRGVMVLLTVIDAGNRRDGSDAAYNLLSKIHAGLK